MMVAKFGVFQEQKGFVVCTIGLGDFGINCQNTRLILITIAWVLQHKEHMALSMENERMKLAATPTTLQTNKKKKKKNRPIATSRAKCIVEMKTPRTL